MYVSANEKAVSLNLHRYNAAAAALGAEQQKQQLKTAQTVKPKTPPGAVGPRFIWRKTIVTVQKENEAKEAQKAREARELLKKVTGFGGRTLA
jgi:hypothetical protein